MPLEYQNLDLKTRAHMLAEIQHDVSQKTLYISSRLTEEGAKSWVALLTQATQQHNDAWLANELQRRNYMRTHEERRKPAGGTTTVKIPATATTTLSEGEFNRFYIRGVCLNVIESGGDKVIAYRARHSDQPRPESQAMIGKSFSASALLTDLRNSSGIDTAFGLPPGPNSGLSVKSP